MATVSRLETPPAMRVGATIGRLLAPRERQRPAGLQALASSVLMVRPASFAANPETAATNRFQASGGAGAEVAEAARREFDAVAEALVAAGVEVIALEDTREPPKPDAVFPNNWLTTHADGTVALYPMLAPSRRGERRSDLCEALRRRGRLVTAVLDLSPWERRDLALEGTGSLVLDRGRKIAYACRSRRTAPEPLAQWAGFFGYTVHPFDAVDDARRPIYHTNVMLALGRGFAVAALEAVPEKGARLRLQASLEAGGNEVVALSRHQMSGFGANLLHLAGSRGPVIAMSETARASLGDGVLARLARYGTPLTVSIPTIERYGGGSVRCMLAEVFLPAAD